METSAPTEARALPAGTTAGGGPRLGGVWHRAAPVACGVALAGAAAYVAAHDPAAPGSRFPACLFHATTGLWCPGCGLTRATHALLRGDIGLALGTNVFTPLALALIAGTWWGWLRRSWDRPSPRRIAQRLPTWTTTLLASAMVVYGVARNLPWAPLRALTP